MSRLRCFVASILAFLIAAALPTVASAGAVIGPSWATKMLFYNASNNDCVVIAACSGTHAGCPTNATGLRWVDLTANGAPTALSVFPDRGHGWFLLKRGHTVQLYGTTINPANNTPTYCIDSFNIGFQGIANSCPLVSMSFPNITPGPKFNQDISKYLINGLQPAITLPPNGVNGFEGSINLVGNAFSAESVDISCVNGANSKLQMQITPPIGGPYWTYNAGPQAGGNITYTTTANFTNSWLNVKPATGPGCDDNCVDPKTGLARPGVFPYGCTICNRFPDVAPPCTAVPGVPAQICAAHNFQQSLDPGSNGCQLNRSAVISGPQQLQKYGGTILVTYYGPLTPPPKCP